MVGPWSSAHCNLKNTHTIILRQNANKLKKFKKRITTFYDEYGAPWRTINTNEQTNQAKTEDNDQMQRNT